MKLDFANKIDAIETKTKEIAETTQDKTEQFHKNYVSKVLPDCGKYGDAAKFAAELMPGVSEYNAIREGDWEAFAISAGLDAAAIGAGLVTFGAGAAAVKGGSVAAKTGAKAVAKEVIKKGAEKSAKEMAESGAEKAAKELAESGAEKVAKEITESGADKIITEATEDGVKIARETVKEGSETIVKEVDETAQIVKNKLEGTEREVKVLEKLVEDYGENNVLREVLIRDSTGTPIKDIAENSARRIDAVIIDGKKVIRSIEVTSETAPKGLQMAKEWRILEQARETGGAFIKNTNTGELIKFGEEIATEIVRVK